jgi:hypothetical protein
MLVSGRRCLQLVRRTVLGHGLDSPGTVLLIFSSAIETPKVKVP